MVFFNSFSQTLPIVFFYMLTYNLTLIGLFWVLMSFLNHNFKTLYSFNVFSFDSSYLLFLTVFLFSLAGVPPFLGFFSKIYLLNILVGQNFFTFYSVFITLLMYGLYFYIQNLRFLHSTNHKHTSNVFLRNERKSFTSLYYLILLTFTLINGVFIIEDLLIYFYWLLF